jgi:hypothetical protein
MPPVVFAAATSRLTLRLLSFGIIPKERSEEGRFSIARRSRDESLSSCANSSNIDVTPHAFYGVGAFSPDIIDGAQRLPLAVPFPRAFAAHGNPRR